MCNASRCDRKPTTMPDNLENAFTKVSKAMKGDGQSIGQEAVESWLTKAQVIDGKDITKEEFVSAYQKLGKPNIEFSELGRLLADLASTKKLDVATLKEKLAKAA